MNRTHALLAPALLLGCLPVGCISVDLGGLGQPGKLVESVVYGEAGPKILLLEIDGTLVENTERGPLGVGVRESPVARIREELEQAREQREIRALLLRINSPGGTVTASEILYREIRRFKEETGVPVVASILGVATSGGYYAAMAADSVLAHPTSVTGSIGVILLGVNVAGLMQKLGVEDQTLTSGPYKDAGSPLRPMTEEERRQLQGVLADLHERFVEVVDGGRPGLDRAQVRALADGRVFSAKQAQALGLVDGIADLPEAVQEAERRAGLTRSRVVTYHRPREHRENLYSAAPRLPRAQGLLPGAALPAGFLYLGWPWTP